MFLLYFDVLFDLLVNRLAATWNLFVLFDNEAKKLSMMMSSLGLFSKKEANQNVWVIQLIM